MLYKYNIKFINNKEILSNNTNGRRIKIDKLINENSKILKKL